MRPPLTKLRIFKKQGLKIPENCRQILTYQSTYHIYNGREISSAQLNPPKVDRLHHKYESLINVIWGSKAGSEEAGEAGDTTAVGEEEECE